MGMWVILIGDERFNLGTIKNMKFIGCERIAEHEEKQLDVFYKKGYASFGYDYDGLIRGDYSPEEIARLPYEEPHFISMQYSNSDLLKRIIGSTDFPKDILIDCDGVDLGLEQIIDGARLFDVGE